ncbi:MAG: HlyD family efflux transporter periplasmic adaptor subunit [Bacteroidetes bacterium]|nr:MAG: HlyD family efflux transporter periplasmic adaptor subunit [Bacteroidota bacterium]
MSRKLSIGLGIALLILAGFGASFMGKNRPPSERNAPGVSIKQVRTLTSRQQDLPSIIEITGRLSARERVELFAEVGGILKEGDRFREGNSFQKGQTMLRVDDEEARLSLLAQKSSLMNQITLMLPDLKTDYPESFPQWAQYLAQFDPAQPLAALPEPVDEREKYFVSARNLYNLFYTIQSQETRLGKYVIKAPFSGVVAEANIKEGTLVRVGQKLGEFFNPYSYELEAAVSLGDLEYLKAGNRVTLRSTNLDGSWQGVVNRISNQIDPNTQTAKVFINTSGRGLREGMYLSGEVAGRALEAVTEIPRALLIDQQAVFVVRDSMLALHPVQPVRYGTETVVVRGIPTGTTLLGQSLVGAYEGMKVAPFQPAAE